MMAYAQIICSLFALLVLVDFNKIGFSLYWLLDELHPKHSTCSVDLNFYPTLPALT